MARTIFYHNITKNILNCTDKEAFALKMDEGDTVVYSASGEAILYPIIPSERAMFIKIKQDLEDEEE